MKSPIFNVEVCRILKQRYPERYGKPREKPSAERIAKEVNKAQDPKYNPALANLVNTFIQMSRFEHAQKRIAWNADIESKKTKDYINMVTKLITSKRSETIKKRLVQQ